MSEYESYDYGYDDWGEDGFYDGPKERTYNHVDAFIWLIFPVALLGFISSITSLIFLALFPKYVNLIKIDDQLRGPIERKISIEIYGRIF